MPPMKRSVALLAALASAMVAIAVSSGCLYVLNKAQPDTEPIARDPSRVDRGRYLAEHVSNCFACHPTGPKLTGQHHWGHDSGIPGEVWASNITPDTDTGLGNWTDGQIVRAIREGVDNDHEALAPVMPYLDFAAMSDEDARSVVAFLRTRPAEHIEVPPHKFDFPFSLVVNPIPKPVEAPVKAPDRHDKLAYGKYLAGLAACASCHTPWGQQGPDTKLQFAGGRTFGPDHADGKEVVSPNITSDPETGIGAWTDDEIREVITMGKLPGDKLLRGPMPSKGYSGMTDEDLAALVAYVRTIPPIKHKPRG